MSRLSAIVFVLGAGLLFSAVLLSSAPGAASPLAQDITPTPTRLPNLSISDEYCLSCHGQPGQTMPLEDGTTLDLYVDPLEHANSIHGSQGYACVQCHNDVGEYPHPPFSATNRRDVTLQLNHVCARCHVDQYDKTLDSVHSNALQAGNTNAAVCTDCHTAHSVMDWVDEDTGETLPEARIFIPQTCAQCHSEIYDNYLTSVHGEALSQGNSDVPTCIDCHGVHNIPDPTTSEFRLASPTICADCHTDPARMAKYGISTDVLDTYVADFHGTTVTIFEKQSPDQQTNKPVCYDCHGVHDIKRADDPEKGLHVKENMLVACQKCHPDATENFPTSWLSHYIPSPEKYPLVYYINLFYLLFIPTVLGGMALLVVMDISRKALDLRKNRQVVVLPPATDEAAPAESTPDSATAQATEPEIGDENNEEPPDKPTSFEPDSPPGEESPPISQPPSNIDQTGEEADDGNN